MIVAKKENKFLLKNSFTLQLPNYIPTVEVR